MNQHTPVTPEAIKLTFKEIETFHAIAPNTKTIGNMVYLPDAKGKLVPVETIKPMDKLQDETVRKIMGYAVPLSEQVARFKAHSFDDLAALSDLILQEYGARPGGKKGNATFISFDGLLKVSVSIQDVMDFGPELQAAKALIDECLIDWTEASRPELRALVTDAFQVDKQGKIARGKVLGLRKIASDDLKWQRAMDAINDSIRVLASKTYIRFHRRDRPDAAWDAVTIDIAQA